MPVGRRLGRGERSDRPHPWGGGSDWADVEQDVDLAARDRGVGDRDDDVAGRVPGDRSRCRLLDPAGALRCQAGHRVARRGRRRADPRGRRHRLRPGGEAGLPAHRAQRLRGARRRDGRVAGRERRPRRARHGPRDPDANRRPERDLHRPPPIHPRVHAPRCRRGGRRAVPRRHRQRRDAADPALRSGVDRIRRSDDRL